MELLSLCKLRCISCSFDDSNDGEYNKRDTRHTVYILQRLQELKQGLLLDPLPKSEDFLQ